MINRCIQYNFVSYTWLNNGFHAKHIRSHAHSYSWLNQTPHDWPHMWNYGCARGLWSRHSGQWDSRWLSGGDAACLYNRDGLGSETSNAPSATQSLIPCAVSHTILRARHTQVRMLFSTFKDDGSAARSLRIYYFKGVFPVSTWADPRSKPLYISISLLWTTT